MIHRNVQYNFSTARVDIIDFSQLHIARRSALFWSIGMGNQMVASKANIIGEIVVRCQRMQDETISEKHPKNQHNWLNEKGQDSSLHAKKLLREDNRMSDVVINIYRRHLIFSTIQGVPRRCREDGNYICTCYHLRNMRF
jgi:hypothetical protein